MSFIKCGFELFLQLNKCFKFPTFLGNEVMINVVCLLFCLFYFKLVIFQIIGITSAGKENDNDYFQLLASGPQLLHIRPR